MADDKKKIIEVEKEDYIKQIRVLTRKVEELNKKLIDSERLKSHFLSNIRNEFVNPLSAIIGLSDSIVNNKDIPRKELDQLINLINSDAYHLQFQLENIFLSAELESGEASPEYTEIHINSLIGDVCQNIYKIYRDIDFTINRVNKTPDQKTFITEASFLKLILVNLLKNAVEFSKENIDITISYEINDKNLSISVEDAGIGIDKINQKIIFDRFRQLDQGHTKKHGGHGLGLSTVKACLETIEGEITVQSSLHNGSIFRIVLPKAQNNEELNGFDFTADEFSDEDFDSF